MPGGHNDFRADFLGNNNFNRKINAIFASSFKATTSMTEKKNLTTILHRMEDIEKELRELRADLIQYATPMTYADRKSGIEQLQYDG